jgi:hypothetical protein
MRRTIVIAAAALAAVLATAGIAVATLRATGTEAVSATFSATTVERIGERACVGVDGNYEITHARYTGEARSSNEALNGPVVIQVRSVYNTTKKLGTVEGWYRIRKGEDERNAHGRLFAVNTDGTLDGYLVGRSGWRYAELLGSFTAKFAGKTGFSEGTIGSGTATNAAVLAGRPCVGGRPGSAVKLSVKGTVESVDDKQITVKPRDGQASQSCVIGERKPEGVKQGDSVHMECRLIDGAMTLTELKHRGNR